MCELKKAEATWKAILLNGTKLYRYVKPQALPPGQLELPSSIFNDPSLSCDIAEMIEDLKEVEFVKNFGCLVVEINVTDDIRNPMNPNRKGELVEAWHQTILADPVVGNNAHALIEGKKKAAVVHNLVSESRIVELTT